MNVIYQPGWSVKDIAALAPIVAQEAASKDAVALGIIEEAVQELVKATQVVVDSIFSHSDIVEVVTTGSIWQGFSLMREQFEAAFATYNPGVKIVSPRYEPAYGAGLLALENLSNFH